MARAYYNEIEPDAVLVLRQLIVDGVIAPGDVDDRSIKDVSPDDLRGYTQCHFFAGGGLWSVAARLAGWPDERPLWTGSCPCQPFSTAGKGRGADDPRHLWPDFHRLIRAGRPSVVMGEQVAGKAGRHWLHGVRTDLAGSGYAGRAVDIPACAVDAPHQRNRLYWIAVADAERAERGQAAASEARPGRQAAERDESSDRSRGRRATGDVGQSKHSTLRADAGELAAASCKYEEETPREGRDGYASRHADDLLRNGSWWSDAEWIECHDGKARRTQSGTPLLVDGLPGRVGLWRLAGNGISPVLAAEVIGAFLDTEEPHPMTRLDVSRPRLVSILLAAGLGVTTPLPK